jgi:hypothetical protein
MPQGACRILAVGQIGQCTSSEARSGALSSAAERPAHNRLVAGSNPAGPIGLDEACPWPVIVEGNKVG